MNKDEFIKRFLQTQCDEEDRNQQPSNNMYLSSDRILGIPTHEDSQSGFMSFGRYKLKRGRWGRRMIISISGMFFNVELLYKAMYVLHRRTKFELGLFNLGSGEVFAVREQDNIVLIAPAVYEGGPKESLDFQDLVVRGNKQFFEKWKTWSRILLGRKS